MTNEELVLLIQRSDNKKEYLEELYGQNYRLIATIAKKYSGVYELDDLMQESYIGLTEAVESYNPEGGFKFFTYASECIRYHLLNYLRDHGCSVRIPAHLQEKTRKLNKAIDDYYKLNAHEPSKKELAKILQIPQDQIEKLLIYRQLQSVKSLNEVISTADDSIELADAIPDPVNQYEESDDKIQHEQLKEVLWPIVNSLEPIQAETIKARYKEGLTLEETAVKFNFSITKVRNTESKAFRKLRLSKNTRLLRPFLSDERIYSISLHGGYQSYINTWTSAPEQAILLAERVQG